MRPAFDTRQPDRLPTGATFPFWADATRYARVFHVARNHPAADDANDGSENRPWATLRRAAGELRPGEKVVVHAGIYRECVRPARGGEGPDRMIAYEAAPGESVAIRGSEVWRPRFVPGTDWRLFRGGPAEVRVWIGELPAEWFVGEHPFLAPNLARSGWFPWQKRPMEEVARAQRCRGMVFQDGRPLQQTGPQGLLEAPGRFWAESRGRYLAIRPHDDAAPDDVTLEVTTRTQCFAPSGRLGWVRVSGFVCEHAATAVPVPQYGALSAGGGHHWILDGNTVRHSNAVGIDIGRQADIRPADDGLPGGGHIVRGNTVTDCGITGLCGTHGVNGSLVEGNRFERIGGLDLEHCYEAAAIKFHFMEGGLIRNNRIRDCRAACGIWLDFLCHGNRVTGNDIRRVETVLAGIYLEACPGEPPNLVDRNRVADLRDHPPNDPPKDGIPGGMGISVDICENVWVLDNVIERCEHHPIACHQAQPGRSVRGIVPSGTGMRVFGNRIRQCREPIRIEPAQGNAAGDNRHDGEGPQGPSPSPTP